MPQRQVRRMVAAKAASQRQQPAAIPVPCQRSHLVHHILLKGHLPLDPLPPRRTAAKPALPVH